MDFQDLADEDYADDEDADDDDDADADGCDDHGAMMKCFRSRFYGIFGILVRFSQLWSTAVTDVPMRCQGLQLRNVDGSTGG